MQSETEKCSSRVRKFDRRSLLRASGAATLAGVAGVSSIAAGRSDRNSRVDIPKYVQRDEVVEYTTVPEDWYGHLKHARRVNARFKQRYLDTDGVVGVGLGQSNQTFGGHNGLGIWVQVDTPRLTEELPAALDGIPVRRTEAPDKWGPGFCKNVTDDLDVYGAEAYRVPNLNNAGSTGCRVYKDGSKEMLTCAHTFWGDNQCNETSDSDITGSVVEQYDGDGDSSDNQKYGEVTVADKNADYAVFDASLNADVAFKDEIDDNNGGVPVRGYVDRDTLSHWASDSHIVKNMGCTTGLTDGDVGAVDYSLTGNCTNLADRGVYTYCDMGQGDSGGPTYDVSNGEAYMVSCTTYWYYQKDKCGGNKIGNDSAGVSADYISEQGIYFIDSSNL